MKRNRFTVEQIIRMLRETEVHLSQGKSVRQARLEGRTTELTYYGGPRSLKELEQENLRTQVD
jgi:hypothetical protein